MTTGEMDTIKLKGEKVEVVDKFQFLGVLVTSDVCEVSRESSSREV